MLFKISEKIVTLWYMLLAYSSYPPCLATALQILGFQFHTISFTLLALKLSTSYSRWLIVHCRDPFIYFMSDVSTPHTLRYGDMDTLLNEHWNNFTGIIFSWSIHLIALLLLSLLSSTIFRTIIVFSFLCTFPWCDGRTENRYTLWNLNGMVPIQFLRDTQSTQEIQQ